MRKKLIAGNWKMNKTEAEAIALVRVLMQRLPADERQEVLVCPPYTSLSQLHKLLISSPILLGAQNISEKGSGAFTGEISAGMAAEFCSHVILGHSERRQIFGETDQLINHKVKAAQAAGLVPILCVGEILEQRESGQTAAVISRQLLAGLEEVFLEDPARLVIAYEPVWAIGSGKTASPADTDQLISRAIRPALSSLWGENAAKAIRVLYGGSVTPDNAKSFFVQAEIDGALVGGASLNAGDFLGIIAAAS